MPNRSRLAVAVALAALASAAACSDLDQLLDEADSPTASGELGEVVPFSVEVDGAALTASIEALTVAEEADDGYDRSLFPHWKDTNDNGCTAREDTLLAEDRSGSLSEDDCDGGMVGQWVSMFDGETVTESGEVDIDHFVPLKEAWGSGAHAWSTADRESYANSLDEPWHLVAVTASSNRSKSDQDPADWMPPLQDVWCAYVWAWVEVKAAWDLSVDEAERDALLDYAADC